MNKISNQFSSIEQVTDQFLNNNLKSDNKKSNVSFEEILKEKQIESSTGLRFSKHASMRLCDRDIVLSDAQSKRLADGVVAAERKGVNDSLVMVDDYAFIVNVPNKTVVTAMDKTETNNNVFTNIDGAVIM